MNIGIQIPVAVSSLSSFGYIVRSGSTESLGFPGGAEVKASACNVGDLGLIPGLGRSLGEGKGHSFQCSGLENSMECVGL